jgi:hypothetical protein
MENESFVAVVAQPSEKVRICGGKYSLVVHERSNFLQLGTNLLTKSRMLKQKVTFVVSRRTLISVTLVGLEKLSFNFGDSTRKSWH